MESMSLEIEGVHVGVGDLNAFRVGICIELAADGEAGFGGGRSDQLDDGLIADERPAAPVLGDEREEAVLDLVPFAGAWREMTDGDVDIEFVGESLKFDLPQAHT